MPKGPTSYYGGDGDYAVLSAAMTAANGNSPEQNHEFTGPMRGVFSGFRDSGVWDWIGADGHYWTSTMSDANLPYFMDIYHFMAIPEGTGRSRDARHAVRCLLD